eukprot:scaffold5064_cov115-Isochrysis_galbana.AAC.1
MLGCGNWVAAVPLYPLPHRVGGNVSSSRSLRLPRRWGRGRWVKVCLARACLAPCRRAGHSGTNVPFCGPRHCSLVRQRIVECPVAFAR